MQCFSSIDELLKKVIIVDYCSAVILAAERSVREIQILLDSAGLTRLQISGGFFLR